MTTPERILWQSVVLKAILDATCPITDNTNAEQRRETRRADIWLRSGGKDFHDVCHMAGLDPQFVRDRYEAGKINRPALRSSLEAAE